MESIAQITFGILKIAHTCKELLLNITKNKEGFNCKREEEFIKIWKDGKAVIEIRTLINGSTQIRKARHEEAKVGNDYYWSPNIVEEVRQLKKEKKYSEAEYKLRQVVIAAKKDAELSGYGVAPWAFEQLAIIYRKQKKKEEEIKILKEFSDLPHAPGVMPQKLLERLKRLLTP